MHKIVKLSRNRMKGFTLVELLVSMLLFLLISFAVLYIFNEYNHIQVKNILRNNAVELATRTLELAKNGNCTNQNINIPVRGFSQPVQYIITCNQTRLYEQGKRQSYRLEINIQWTYKGVNYNYTLTGIYVGEG